VKPVTTRVRTDLSELEASVPLFSPEMQERLRQTHVNREGDGKAEPGSQRELRDLGTDPVETPGFPTQTKRRRPSIQKGKEPERMPTVEEQHSMHQPQQPLPEIAVTSATERHDQPASTATTTTISDPIDTTKTSQPPEVDLSTAESGAVDLSTAGSEAVNSPVDPLSMADQWPPSKPCADSSPTSGVHPGGVQAGDSGSHPQEGGQRCSRDASARQHRQQTWNAPTGATQPAGNGGSIRPAGSGRAVENPAADYSHNGSDMTAMKVVSTGRWPSFRDILQSLLCCVLSPRQ
jgi:hypothetical protein